MSSFTYAGPADPPVSGFCPPPPPPPPPPVSGQLPAMRINTSQPAMGKRPQVNASNAYEPPAAIQNAMLTKDKKPFTYTPGMGGKLDLSQIRSPRMARRVAKNANDEGIEGPPKSALESKSGTGQSPSISGNLFVQPQVAVPVFPANIPPPQPTVSRAPQLPQPSVNRTPQPPQSPQPPPPPPPLNNRLPTNQSEKQGEPVRNVTKVETKIVPVLASSPSSPESPSTPTQVTLQKAPTPWLQNKNKPQEELPEWAKRSSVAKSPNSTPDSPSSPPFQRQQFQQQLTSSPQSQQAERQIPIRIEDRPSVFAAKHEAGHHQFKQPPSVHHQQRWGQSVQNSPQSAATISQSQQPGGAFIIPVMVEGGDKTVSPGPTPISTYPQQNARVNSTESQQPPRLIIQQRGAPNQQGQFTSNEPGPVQSRSFRVLQKMTDTDSPNDVETEQIRKLQLTEDDRSLMNKFKEQVDGDTYLHQEEDPRYRGAAIPSRAFRYLQNMTDSGEISANPGAPRQQNVVNKRQNRTSKSYEGTQANLPPSEQQVPEPKKYMGGAIPSRSFRILQAMTAPESVATQENHQADYTCQTDNSASGNQQGIFFPPCPRPLSFWSLQNGGYWWGYYPVRYTGKNANDNTKIPFDAYLPYPQENNNYAYYPIYGENHPYYQQYDLSKPETVGYDEGNYYTSYSHCADRNNLDQRSYESNSNSRPFNYRHDDDNNGDRNAVRSFSSLRNFSTELNAERSNSDKEWGRSDGALRNNIVVNRDNDYTLEMNRADEEESVPNVTIAGKNLDELDSTKTGSPKKIPPNITVPNYTYIDSSDSSDNESNTDEESVETDSCDVDYNCQNAVNKNNDSKDGNEDSNDSNETSDSDSDSYLAYSTGLNPHGRYDRDLEVATATTCINKRREESECSSDKLNATDCESDAEYEEESPVQIFKGDTMTAERTEVAEENVSLSDSDSSYQKEQNVGVGRTDYEDDDIPDDNVDTATVSVSLPLRFTFSISENNEDVTTVIVGDSTVKSEKRSSLTNGTSGPKYPRHRRQEESDENGVLEMSNDTTVDFTASKLPHEAAIIKDAERNDDKTDGHNESTACVDFTLKRVPSRVNKIHCQEDIETEFTFRAKKLDIVSHLRRNKRDEENSQVEEEISNKRHDRKKDESAERLKSSEELNNRENHECEEELEKETLSAETANTQKENIENSNDQNEDDEDIDFWAEIRGNANNDSDDYSHKILKPTVVVSECNCTEDTKIPEEEPEICKALNDPHESGHGFSPMRNEGNETYNADTCQIVNDTKHLLSVQTSREETDDEDSGVTSDMSRMISEADTDSECTTTRKMSKYQRTQTHSRLFRLLYDNSSLSEDTTDETTETAPSSALQRKYLSLPLTGNAFNYDENYYSNYSSGLTSPEYSPVCEQSWRRFHETENKTSTVIDPKTTDSKQEKTKGMEDPYFQAWKTSKPPDLQNEDVIPSLAFKILESKMPYWAYKVNVLCPRIKSTKSVPQTLRQGNRRSNSSMVPPLPASYARNNRC